MGLAGFVLGLVGAVLGLITILAIPALICGVLGLVFGIVGVRRKGAPHGMAIAGIILGALARDRGIRDRQRRVYRPGA